MFSEKTLRSDIQYTSSHLAAVAPIILTTLTTLVL